MQTNTNTQEVYLPDHVYKALQEKLAQLAEQKFEECTGRRGIDPKSAIVEVLSDIGNIWPVSVLRNAGIDKAG